MNPSDFAATIATQWHEVYGTNRLEVPMSVLATLTLRQHLRITAEESSEPHGFLAGQQRVWENAAQQWPYLYHRWECLIDWPTWPDHHRTTHAATVFALRLRTLGVPEHLPTLAQGHDFLGGVLHRLRGPMMTGSVDPLSTGEAVRLHQDMPVQTLTLDHAGTGHRVLGVLSALDSHGVDPKTVTWRLREIDELSAATMCVNLAAWHVADPERANLLVAVSEDDDWIQDEQEARAETLRTLFPSLFDL